MPEFLPERASPAQSEASAFSRELVGARQASLDYGAKCFPIRLPLCQ